MTDHALRAWLGLNMTLTPHQVHLLLNHFSSAAGAWGATLPDLQQVEGFGRYLDGYVKKRPTVNVDQELSEIERRHMRALTLADDAYPSALRTIKTPPPVLYVYGQMQLSDALALAVVGTRKMSAYGRRSTQTLVAELSRRGFTIVSGLALGVDTIAHQTALDSGGRTLAVLGSGMGNVYPPENRQLAEAIAQSGAVISEFPPFNKWQE